MPRIARQTLLDRFRAKIAAGRPLTGGGAGTRLSAKCEEAGGIDLIVIYNSGRYRMAGRGSLAGLLAYGNANQIVCEMAHEVLPVVRHTPVLAGVNGTDPFMITDRFLRELIDQPDGGEVLHAREAQLDGSFRANLEETGMGYGVEVEMIGRARALDLLTTPYVFSEADARAMAGAGADIVVCHLGLTTGGAIGAETALQLSDCVAPINAWAAAAKAVNPDVFVLCHGGPIATPEDAQFILRHCPACHGFYGASSMERLPTEVALTETTRRFVAMTRCGRARNMHLALCRWPRWTVLPLVLPVLLALAACASMTPPTPQVAAMADRVIDEVVATSGFSGAVVLMRDGAVVYERAVGLAQRSPDRPFTVDTPSDGGSLAKTLTAAAIWELAAEGRLSLDDAVTRHLPAYPYAGQTLRDLVTHRSGLPDYGAFEDELKARGVLHTPDLLTLTAQRQPQPLRPPGVRVEYANLGFDAAALVIERVTGRPVAEFWRERYFVPLGLGGMFARPARFAEFPVPRTVGYRRDGGAWVTNDAYDGEGFIGASNVHASARDWARWGDAFAGGRVMARERLDAGLRQAMLDSGLANALTMLSWYCDAARQRCHYTGAYNGFYAQVWWDRTRRETVAYVSNSTLPAWRCARLTRDLVDALAGRAPATDVTPPLRAVARADLPALAGSWRSPTLGPLALSVRDGKAFLRVGRGELASVFQVEREVFYVPTLDLWLAFSGPPESPSMHIRSVFHVAEARRLPAPTS